MSQNRTPLTKAFWRHKAFLPSRTRLNLTIIQIMQLKRSYSRRLKFEIAFYEFNFITRRAYHSINLAVKTSRPQNIMIINKYAKLLKTLQFLTNPLTFVQNLYQFLVCSLQLAVSSHNQYKFKIK